MPGNAALLCDQPAFRVDDSFEDLELGAFAGVAITRVERTHGVGEVTGRSQGRMEALESFRLLQEKQQYGGDMLAHAGIPAAIGADRGIIIGDVAVSRAGAEIVIIVDVIVVVIVVETVVFRTVVVEGPAGAVAVLGSVERGTGAVAG